MSVLVASVRLSPDDWPRRTIALKGTKPRRMYLDQEDDNFFDDEADWDFTTKETVRGLLRKMSEMADNRITAQQLSDALTAIAESREVSDYDVPILATLLGLPLPGEPQAEPTVEKMIEELNEDAKQLLPFLDGERYIIEIEEMANMDLDAIKRIVKDMYGKKLVYMAPKLIYEDMYGSKLKLSLLFFHRKMQQMCIKFISYGTSSKGMATMTDVMMILGGLQFKCMNVRDLMKKHAEISGPNFEFSRLIIFAVLHGLIISLGADPALM